MNANELISQIREFCQLNANPENQLKSSRYFKGAMDFYGLTQPQMNEQAKVFLKNPSITLPVILEAAPALMKSGKYEETTFFLLMTDGKHKYFDAETLAAVESWFSQGITNWAHADTLGMWVLPKLVKKGILTLQDISKWVNSPFPFQRRCLPVTLIKSLKTTHDYFSLFQIITPLMTDPVREVHQGTGWFLREAWKLKPLETEAYLLPWKDTSPRLIFQYACEKMTPENKLRFKRDKSA